MGSCYKSVCLCIVILSCTLYASEPNLVVSETAVEFVVYEADANPDPNILTISNTGSGMLNWSITNPNEAPFSPPAWLTVTPTSGALDLEQSEPVMLSVDTIGLSDGYYSYAFEVIADPNAQNSLQNILVQLTVVEPDAAGIFVPFDYSTIQSAIYAAVNGDTIVVLPGTYYENVYVDPNILNNLVLTSIAPDDPNVVAATVIDGGGTGRVVSIPSSMISLRGFTVTNGYIGKDTTVGGFWGGGVWGGTITNCVITGNRVLGGYNSGGAGLYDCDGPITNCIITDNTVTGNRHTSGGGLAYCDGPITNCAITDNTLTSRYTDGGGLAYCDGPITNCTIAGNEGIGQYSHGGGLYECWGQITKCLIIDNSAGYGGGLERCGDLINCTIVGNSASYYGGGGSNLCWKLIFNCIFWDNTPSKQISNSCDAVIPPAYSCIQNWTDGGTGNISSDPLFADPNTGPTDPPGRDLHLKSEYGRWQPYIEEYSYLDSNDPNDPNDDVWVTVPAVSPQWVFDGVTSPCIDAGDSTDLNWQNELWPHGGRVNMGAYGGTAQASMSPSTVGNVADIDHDDEVGILDLELFCDDWLLQDSLLDTDLDLNGVVDIADLAVFGNHWLWVEP